MILIIFIISILFIAATIFAHSWFIVYDLEFLYNIILSVELLIAIGVLVAFIVCFCTTVSAMTVKERLKMYQDENADIEQRVARMINKYMEYEKGLYSNIRPENSMTYVVACPELVSNILVKSQIEAYISNKQIIKELKEEVIMIELYRWLLYLG